MSEGRSCYACGHHRESLFCGYASQTCTVHGSLDVDQDERHPDTTGATCPDFTPKVDHPPRVYFADVLDRIARNGHRSRGRW